MRHQKQSEYGAMMESAVKMTLSKRRRKKSGKKSLIPWRGIETKNFPDGKIVVSRDWPDGTRTLILEGGSVWHLV